MSTTDTTKKNDFPNSDTEFRPFRDHMYAFLVSTYGNIGYCVEQGKRTERPPVNAKEIAKSTKDYTDDDVEDDDDDASNSTVYESSR